MILYHNTSNENAIKIADEGIICGLRADVYGKGSDAEGAGIWCTIQRGYGYGGATITFEIDDNDELLKKQNDTEYILYRNVEPNEIIDIDLVISSISSISGHTGTVESDIPNAIKKFGKDKILQVFKKNESKFVNPYNYDKLVNLIEIGNKALKGTISLVENKKITEDINNYKSTIEEINKIVDTCKKYNIIKDLRKYTIPAMRNYQLQYNPTADSRKAPWVYLINEINSINGEMDSTLVDFIDDFIREGNQCIKDNTKTESNKLQESLQDQYKYIKGFVEADQDKYSKKHRVTDISYSTTKNGEPKLEFNADGNNVIILEYPPNKDGKKYYCYLNNNKYGYISSAMSMLDNLTESKKLEEASRNELLAKAKAETITRYNKSAGYKGFSLVDIDTTAIKTRDSIIITNNVGKYFDSVELDDILYWVGLEVTEARDNKMTQKVVEKALLGAMDGMDIKVDCNCGDFVYRFAYMATQFEYKYGKPETRPSDITNPDGYGAMCKHLIALLSNKSWISQVASTLQQWIIDEIDWVRDFLKMSEEEFKLPDEYARYLGKHGAMKKFWDKQPNEEEQDIDNDEANEDSDSDIENDETTNDNPDIEDNENDNEEETKL